MSAESVQEQTLSLGETDDDTKKVPLKSLSEMTGFPVEFIKTELFLKDDELTISDLRESMLSYLEDQKELLK